MIWWRARTADCAMHACCHVTRIYTQRRARQRVRAGRRFAAIRRPSSRVASACCDALRAGLRRSAPRCVTVWRIAPRRRCRVSRHHSRPPRREGGAAGFAGPRCALRWLLRWPRRGCTARTATCRRKLTANASSWCAPRRAVSYAASEPEPPSALRGRRAAGPRAAGTRRRALYGARHAAGPAATRRV